MGNWLLIEGLFLCHIEGLMFTGARVAIENSGEASSYTSKEPPANKLRPVFSL